MNLEKYKPHIFGIDDLSQNRSLKYAYFGYPVRLRSRRKKTIQRYVFFKNIALSTRVGEVLLKFIDNICFGKDYTWEEDISCHKAVRKLLRQLTIL